MTTTLDHILGSTAAAGKAVINAMSSEIDSEAHQVRGDKDSLRIWVVLIEMLRSFERTLVTT